MIETLSISLSGPALSFLLYENLKNKFSQEGFLIGELVEKETKTITDNDQQQVHISRIIRISSAVPSSQHYFYDAIGRIDPEKIRNFLGDLMPKVVAWYKYKPSSSFNFTFREKMIHKQLANLFNLPPEFFSCCLLISECSDNNATCSFTQTFTRVHNNNYEQIPLHIINLSDANNTYKIPEQVSTPFQNIVGSLKINHQKTQGINIISKIQTALQKHTDQIVEELAEVEEKLFQLENEVKHLLEGVKNQSASNKETQLNDMIMDTDPEVSPASSPTKMRGRGKGNRNSQSPVKKPNPAGREIITRSKKKSLG